MTRLLSDLLEAPEPFFQQSLRQLERIAGHPGADIRLSSDITSGMHRKITELGLDSQDTTGRELYAALGSRVHQDEKQLRESAAGKSSVLDGVGLAVLLLKLESAPLKTYAMKSAAMRRVLRLQPPRKTMKALGYRSIDSLLKHESPAAICAAAWLCESRAWISKLHASYAKLKAVDFEIRQLTIEHPSAERWHKFTETIVAASRHQVLGLVELGAVVVLPSPQQRPVLEILPSLVLGFHAINNAVIAGSYIQLHQLQKDFGQAVQQAVLGRMEINHPSLDMPVLWQQVHEYIRRQKGEVSHEFQELSDAFHSGWLSVEDRLASIVPGAEFWQQSSFLALHDGIRAVPLNLTDAVLSHCNALAYERRMTQHFKQSLGNELLLRYLSQERLRQTVLDAINQKFELAPEFAFADI